MQNFKQLYINTQRELKLCNCLSIKVSCGQGYNYIALTTGQYLDIALWSGQYVKYNPMVSFDLSCQSGIYTV